MLHLLSIFLIIGFLVPVTASFAQETNEPAPIKVPTADFSALKHTKSGRIDKVIDGLTVILKDKTIIRLASLDIPDFHIWRDAPYSEAALKLLEETLPEGTEVMIYQTRMAKKGRTNRMNHELAHIQTKATKDINTDATKREPIWIQGLLLAHGLGRVQVAPNASEMVTQMFDAEQTARSAKLGIWADDSDFPILTPETASQSMGEFAIVEGVVEKTASIRNNIYLNFGKDWKKDFTIMITPTLRKKLAHNGIDPSRYTQKPVRVRGWVREYNGPLIELETIEHLEILDASPLQPPKENPKVSANP